MPKGFVYTFDQIEPHHFSQVGHHGRAMGEIYSLGLPIPKGFVVSVEAFEKFQRENNLDRKIKHLLNTVNFADPSSLRQVSILIKKYFTESNLPKNLVNEIYTNYKSLGKGFKDSRVNIRTSHTSHTQHKHQIFTDIEGETNLIEKIKECWAVNYDESHLLIGFGENSGHDFPSAVLVQKSIEPEKSGKIYTSDPYNLVKNRIFIKAMLGIMENKTNFISLPDLYEIDKMNLKIESKEISNQVKMKKNSGKLSDVSSNLRKKQKITDAEIVELAKLGKTVEKIYFFPQEIDWRIENKQIYLIRIKPLTETIPQDDVN